jgi:hypothetical protein
VGSRDESGDIDILATSTSFDSAKSRRATWRKVSFTTWFAAARSVGFLPFTVAGGARGQHQGLVPARSATRWSRHCAKSCNLAQCHLRGRVEGSVDDETSVPTTAFQGWRTKAVTLMDHALIAHTQCEPVRPEVLLLFGVEKLPEQMAEL